MLKRLVASLFALTSCTGILAAQQIEVVPVQPTTANSGKQMFDTYCAVCHGSEGKGNGPAASVLKKRPADLTQLSRANNGRFPGVKVERFIKGSDEIAAHGTRDMPMWGAVFASLNPGNAEVVALRLANLERYIESLQAH